MRIFKRALAGGLCTLGAVGVIASILGYLISLSLFENETLTSVAVLVGMVALVVGIPFAILFRLTVIVQYFELGLSRWEAGGKLWDKLTRGSPHWARRLAAGLSYFYALNIAAFVILIIFQINTPHPWLRFLSFIGLAVWYDCFIVSLAWFQRLKQTGVQ